MADPTVDLWAGDEVHFQQHGSRCRMWVPPETKDPVLLHAPTRRSVGYFGAVRLRDGRFYYCREADKFNGLSFFAFLKGLRRTSIRSGRRVVVITDNAKYHHALLHKPWREEHVDGLCAGLSAALQSRVESDRANLETDTPPLLAQSLLSTTRCRHRGRGGGVRRLGRPQRSPPSFMRNHLGRCVFRTAYPHPRLP